MKRKLTTQEVKYFKDVMKRVCEVVFHLKLYYNVYVKQTYRYNKEWETNEHTIKIYYKVRAKSETTFIIYFYFINELLQNYSNVSSNSYLGMRLERLDYSELDKINTICDNVKEFYKNHE